MEIKKYSFPQHGDSRGQLVALEAGRDFPFPVRRVYYIYDTARGVTRGLHAHKHLEQVLICVHGSCRIRLKDGREETEVLLNKPYEGVYIANNMWREMYDFSSDAVLLVLASEHYDESDYIRNYEDFLKMVQSEGESK